MANQQRPSVARMPDTERASTALLSVPEPGVPFPATGVIGNFIIAVAHPGARVPGEQY